MTGPDPVEEAAAQAEEEAIRQDDEQADLIKFSSVQAFESRGQAVDGRVLMERKQQSFKESWKSSSDGQSLLHSVSSTSLFREYGEYDLFCVHPKIQPPTQAQECVEWKGLELIYSHSFIQALIHSFRARVTGFPSSKASISIKRSGSVNLAQVLSSMSIKLIESGLLVSVTESLL